MILAKIETDGATVPPDRVVDVTPIRGDRRPPPRAQKVEYDRADSDKNQCERHPHPLFILGRCQRLADRVPEA
jgi:hypothetical protein